MSSSYSVGGVDEPPPGNVIVRWIRRIVAFLVICAGVALIGGLAWWFTGGFGSASDVDLVPKGEKVTITVPEGASANQIADQLEQEGLIDSSLMFRIKLRTEGVDTNFRSGTYTIAGGTSFERIVAVLQKGPPPIPVFTFGTPEGYRITQIGQAIDEARAESSAAGGTPLPAFTGRQYLAALAKTPAPAGWQPRANPQGQRLEGFLFPAQYELLQAATPEDLIARQLEAFTDNVAGVDFSAAQRANLTKYDVLIIASMVEREARVASERPLIAGVIWNRLRIGMTLGIDATNQYIADPDEWVTELRQSQLEIDSPYNTRIVAGLPPTPIANPGLASIEAAANPQQSEYLYYVAMPDGSGRHKFFENHDDFLAYQN